jgi:uncharacterized NAD(P)/FAD-binding protein YdhS
MSPAHLDAAIVGGGVSGSALAVALAAQAAPTFRAVLFDPCDPGPGVAYAPQSASLLLNGPVRAMSPVPGDERHLQRYLVDEPEDALICRSRYGAYMRSTVAHALSSHAGFAHERDEVVSVEPSDGAYRLRTRRGRAFTASSVVLALGNFAPADGSLPETLRSFSGYVRDPWSVDVSAFDEGDVVLVGSRLTAMDVVALLDECAHRGRVIVTSRHGLVPFVEDPRVRGLQLGALDLDTSSPRSLVRTMRRAAREAGVDWRAVAETIRPVTPAIWAAWTLRERKQFLRHVQSMWAIHRYRVPPATYAAYERALRSGKLSVHRGRIASARVSGSTVALELQHGEQAQTVRASYVVNCTGPGSDIRSVDRPLVRQMLADGLIRPDALHLGLDADARLRVRSRGGTPAASIYAMGPLLRGLWYETTAIPEIRSHASVIAAAILASARAKLHSAS